MFTLTRNNKWISWLLILLFGLVSLGQLQRIELPLSRALYLHEIVMTVVVLGMAVAGSFRKIKFPLSFKVFNAWVVVSLILLALGGSPFVSGILYLLRFNLYLLFGLSMLVAIKQKMITKEFVWRCMLVSISLIAIFGFFQYFFLPDTRGLVYLGWDDHYLRLISTLFDPGFTGAILALGAIALQFKLFSWEGKKATAFAIHQWLWLLTLGALLLTYSRASYLAFAVGTIVLGLRNGKLRSLFIVLAFAFSILLLPRPRSEGARLERTASIVSRIETYKDSRPQNLIQLLAGKGWYAKKTETTRLINGNQVPSHNSAPDNSFLFVFSSLGAVGLVLFLWLGASLGKLGNWTMLTIASLLAMSVHALFSNSLFYPFVMLYLLTIVSMESKREEYNTNT